ncbi:DUF2071 domain-containing protein [Halorubellus sp. PRR65]|uniref:YqjF family protein n=1 Tax=Halorubellus sp. PRR65 TaxID=3098148 RepID=UPI002B25904E|nr:DUF2071 domain-containing protein [Halorubellus sp. PRR65]
MTDAIRPLSLSLSDACFLHWPVPADAVRPLIPEWTDPDTFDGTAWVSAVALSIDRLDAFELPVREGLEAVSVRTYVDTPGGDRAVCFLSLDVTDGLAADAVRRVFRLPASRATVRRRRDGDRTEVVARRRGGERGRLTVTFEPVGDPGRTAPDTLSSFLVDRSRYVATGPLGTQLVGSVGHSPWRVRSADATVTERSLLAPVGVDATADPSLVHHSPGLDMTVGALVPR